MSRGRRTGRRNAPPLAAALLAAPLILALMVSCSGSGDVGTGAQATTAAPATTKPPEDFQATAADFVNLQKMTAVRNFFIDNKLGHLDEAVAVANSTSKGGVYPGRHDHPAGAGRGHGEAQGRLQPDAR